MTHDCLDAFVQSYFQRGSFRERCTHISAEAGATCLQGANLFGLFPIFDVNTGAIPFDYRSRIVTERHTPHEEPSVLSIGPANACLLCEGTAARHRSVPFIQNQ